jgi:PKD repeat protein
MEAFQLLSLPTARLLKPGSSPQKKIRTWLLSAVVLLFLLPWNTPSAEAQNPCSQLNPNIDQIEPCLWRLEINNNSECTPFIRLILSSGSFSGWNVSSGYIGEQISPTEILVTHTQGFIPVGPGIPIGFSIPIGASPANLSVLWEFACGLGESCFYETTLEGCVDPMNASITGVKYKECGGLPYTNQPTVPGWTIYLLNQDLVLLDSTETDGIGAYTFGNLPKGQYVIKEKAVPSWTPNFPSSGQYSVNLSISETEERNFGNCQSFGTITGVKYHECNGAPYTNQATVPGWTIYLLNLDGVILDSTITDAAGVYKFANLLGCYPYACYIIKEKAAPGWTPNVPLSGQYTVSLMTDAPLVRNFGNCQTCTCDAIKFGVSPQSSTGNNCCYNLNVQNTAGSCYNSILVELTGASTFVSATALTSGWQVIPLNGQQFQVFGPGPQIPSGSFIPVSFCVTGGGTNTIKVSTFYTVGSNDITCASQFSFSCPPPVQDCCPAGNIAGPNLLNNGDFENGTGFGTDYTLSGTCQPARYNVLTGPQLPLMCPEWAGNDHTTGLPTGKMLAVDGSQTPGQAVWRQQVTIAPNTQYVFCGYANNLNIASVNSPDPVVEAWLVNGIYPNNQGVLLATTNALPETPDAWVKFSGTWTAPVPITQTYYVEIRTSGNSFGGNNFAVDDISFYSCQSDPCQADFTFQNIGNCGKFQFTNTSSPGLNYSWNFGDNQTSTLANPSHQFLGCGTYTVCLTISGTNCPSKTICKQIIVTDNTLPVAKCVPGFGIDLNPDCSLALTPAMIDGGSTDDCQILSTFVSPTVITGCGLTTVTLTVFDWCGNQSTCKTSIQTAEGTPPNISCPANISVQGNPYLGAGHISLPAPPVLNDACSAVSYSTDYPNGLFPCGQQTVVTYTASDACTNTATCTMTVTVSDCDLATDTSCCAFSLYLVNQYTDGRIKKVRISAVCDTRICCADPDEWAQSNELPLAVEWRPADGSPVPAGNAIDNDFLLHLSNNVGNNQVQVQWIDFNDVVVCTHLIDINCDGDFTEDEDWTVYTTVVGTDDPNLTCFMVREPDEDEGSICEPEEQEVEECGFNSNAVCVDGTSFGVTLQGPPGYDVYNWVVGTGPAYPSINGTANPYFTVSDEGSYVIQVLAVNSSTGRACTGVQAVIVQKTPVDFSWKFVQCQGGMKVEFTAITDLSLASSYHWDCSPFEAGFPANGPVVEHTFSAPGTYTVTLVIKNIFGCSYSKEYEIEVSMACVPNFRVVSYTFCRNDCTNNPISQISVTLQNTSTGGICPMSYYWQFNGGIDGTQSHDEHTDMITVPIPVDCQNGNTAYPITLSMSDFNSCFGSTTKSIAIVPCDVDFSYTVCPDGRVNLEGNVYGKWDIPGHTSIAPWPYSGLPLLGRFKRLVVRYPPGFHIIKFTGHCDDGGECEVTKKIFVPDACCAKNDRDRASFIFVNGPKSYKLKARMTQNQYPLFVHNVRVVTKLKVAKKIGTKTFWRGTKSFQITAEATGNVFKRDQSTKCNCVIPTAIGPYNSATTSSIFATERFYFTRFRSMKLSLTSTHSADVNGTMYSYNLFLGKDCDKFQWWFDWF